MFCVAKLIYMSVTYWQPVAASWDSIWLSCFHRKKTGIPGESSSFISEEQNNDLLRQDLLPRQIYDVIEERSEGQSCYVTDDQEGAPLPCQKHRS